MSVIIKMSETYSLRLLCLHGATAQETAFDISTHNTAKTLTYLLSRFSGVIHPEQPSKAGPRSARWLCRYDFWMALISYSTHLPIVSSFTTGFLGSLSSKQTWIAVQSINAKSVKFKRLWKDDLHVVSIRTGKRSELGAEHEVRCTARKMSLTTTISGTPDVAMCGC